MVNEITKKPRFFKHSTLTLFEIFQLNKSLDTYMGDTENSIKEITTLLNQINNKKIELGLSFFKDTSDINSKDNCEKIGQSVAGFNAIKKFCSSSEIAHFFYKSPDFITWLNKGNM